MLRPKLSSVKTIRPLNSGSELMNSTQKQAIQRYLRIRRRQPTTATFDGYEPAVKATREEAPRRSRPTKIGGLNPFGRILHAGSDAERDAILLAMFHQRVFALREQYAMHPCRSLHPLANHQKAMGLVLPDLIGTIAVYESLDELECLPLIHVPDENGELVSAPIYLVADLLVFLEDDIGPHVVHWSIKDRPEAFEKYFERPLVRDPKKAQKKHDLRLEIERLYFKSAGIPTRQLAINTVHAVFRSNLIKVYLWASRPAARPIPKSVAELLMAIDWTSSSPLEVERHCLLRHGVSQNDFKTGLYRLIWTHQIAVNLERHILFERPLGRSVEPSLAKYNWLFAREA